MNLLFVNLFSKIRNPSKKLLFPDMPHLSRNPYGKQCFRRRIFPLSQRLPGYPAAAAVQKGSSKNGQNQDSSFHCQLRPQVLCENIFHKKDRSCRREDGNASGQHGDRKGQALLHHRRFRFPVKGRKLQVDPDADSGKRPQKYQRKCCRPDPVHPPAKSRRQHRKKHERHCHGQIDQHFP